MAIGFVQAVGNNSGTATLATAYASAQTAGNQNFVFVYASATGTPSVTDSSSNSYTLLGSTSNAAQDIYLYLFGCFSIAAAGAGSNTVTAVAGGTVFGTFGVILEYSGVSSTQDSSTATGQSFGTTASTSAITTTNAVDLILAVVGTGATGSATAGTGFTLRAQDTVTTTLAEDQITTATGTYTPTATVPNGQWVALAMAFKGAASNVTPTLTGTISVTGALNVSLPYETDLTGTTLVSGLLSQTLAVVPSPLTGSIGVSAALNTSFALSPLTGTIGVNGVLSLAALPAGPLTGSVGVTGILSVLLNPIMVNLSGSIGVHGQLITTPPGQVTGSKAVPFPFYIYGL
jgi:hypothetical protein